MGPRSTKERALAVLAVLGAAALVAAVATLAVTLGAGPAEAFLCTAGNSNAFVSIHWDTRAIPVAIRGGASTTIPADALDRLLRAAFAEWSGRACSDVGFDFGPVVADEPPYDNLLCTGARDTKSTFDAAVGLDRISQVVMVHDCWPHDESILALTTMTFGARDGVIRYGVIEVNERRPPATTGFVFQEVDTPETCRQSAGDVYDLGAVVTHEVGHFLGLAHTDVRGTLPGDRPSMTAIVEPCDPDFRSLSADDVDGLCYVYPASQGARQCLPLPDQDGPYIESTAFGCTTAPGREPGGLLVMVVALFVGRRAKACSAARSRR